MGVEYSSNSTKHNANTIYIRAAEKQLTAEKQPIAEKLCMAEARCRSGDPVSKSDNTPYRKIS